MSTTLIAPSECITATWRGPLRGASTGQLVLAGFMFLLGVVFERRIDPTSIVIAAVVAVGLALLRRSEGRGAVIYAGVVSLLLFGMVAAFNGLTVFTRVQSTFELILFGSLLVVCALGLVSAVGALRGGRRRAAEVAPRVAGAAIVLLVVVGVAAGGLTGSAPRMPGDLTLQARQFEFSKVELTARAGRVNVFVENDDVTVHDFSIKGVVYEEVPGQRAARAVFDVRAGTYRFYCSLHPDMEGTLRVS